MKNQLIVSLAAILLSATSAFAATIETADTDIGNVVVAASNGLTLYTFRNDTDNVSNCYDNCAVSWPPFIAKEGAEATADLSIIDRKDGTRQWALRGQPLYFWVGDSERGDVSGEGVGNVWDAARNK